MDLQEEYLQENALILLKGIWYSELPPVINFDDFSDRIMDAIEDIQNKKTDCYILDDDDFITEFKSISSPPYLRKPGVESITFYDIKNNGSLREMQMPNLRHYLAFVYNTLFMYDDIFCKLYTNSNNNHYINNSNSYLMFEKTFEINTGYDETSIDIEAGVFAEKNNKITGSAMLYNNRKNYYQKQSSYTYKLSLDLESFFPNLYTHYFHRIYNKEPFKSLNFPEKYFIFLDKFHQRINDNQTKGIPAGIFSSHVAAELLLLCVDYQVGNLLKGKDISYIRYVDDFTFFSNSQESLDDLKIQLQQILNEYRLRINGNKTQLVPCVFDYPKVDMEEISNELDWLIDKESIELNDNKLFHLKKYFAKCITNKNYPQIKSCLTLFERKISNSLIDLKNTENDLFSYLIQLSQTNVILASKSYSVINSIIKNSTNKDTYIDFLLHNSDSIDLKYSNTILQIWHYYVITNNCDSDTIDELIKKLNTRNNNPIIISMLVKKGSKNNTDLFNYIKNEYSMLSNNNNWKSEIMNSKLWLPLFIIKIKDGYDYENWYTTKDYPDILNNL